jgi:hypothetical protein
MPPHYVDSDYFTQTSIYSAGADISDAAELDRLLERCERDIDSFVGPWSVDLATGTRFGDLVNDDNPQALSAASIIALKDAVCCQALYRAELGEAEWLQGQFDSVSGPDFSTTGRRDRVSPQSKSLLRNAGLLIRGARLR